MNEVVGQVLPLALGIAMSPSAIVAAVLMLLSPKAKRTGVGFLGGWLLAILLVVVVFTLLGALIPPSPDGPQPIIGTFKIVFGLLLLALALRTWRGRPRPGDLAAMPGWMSAIDSMTPGRGFVLGLVLATANPKDLLMGLGAGVAIGTAGLTVGEAAVSIAIFTVVAVSTVAIPVIGFLIAPAMMRTPLQALRNWLIDDNIVITVIILITVGVVVIGQGIAAFQA